ncbi:hypothetical protein UE94_036740, partial [Burkholderia cenocepacia]
VETHYSLQAVAARLGKLYCETADLPENLLASLTRQVDELTKHDHVSQSARPSPRSVDLNART